MPAKYWAHGEWFETLLIRNGGLDAAAKLAAHEIKWTDDVVKNTLKTYAELLKAGCCGTPEQMFAGDWDYAADQIFTADQSNYLLIGMWMNSRARNDYKLTEGVDYSIFQFPSMGKGFDDTSMVDSKEVSGTTNGPNPAAADAFLVYMDGRYDAADRIQEFVEAGTPVIFYDNDADGPTVDRVFVENQAASFRAVSYLLDIGHSRVAVLTGDTKVTAGRQRYEGYRQAMSSAPTARARARFTRCRCPPDSSCGYLSSVTAGSSSTSRVTRSTSVASASPLSL